MTGFKVDIMRCELCCVLDWCVHWLLAGQYSFELRFVSDWCDDWLQAGQYKVCNAVSVRLVWWLATGWKLYGVICGLCQIGVMTCYKLDSIRFEFRCVSDWCDDWLQPGQYNVWTSVCFSFVWWLATAWQYMSWTLVFVRLVWWLATGWTV